MRVFIAISLALAAFLVKSQCPTIASSIDDANLCINEALSITNTSDLSYSSEWDFCDNLLSTANFTSTFISNTSFPRRMLDISFGYDNGWYAYSVSQTDQSLIRYTFGNGLDQSPTNEENLGNIDGILGRAASINLVEQSNTWYALVHTWEGDLSRLTFDNGLAFDPNIELLGTGIGASLSRLEVFETNSDLFAFVVNTNNTLTIIDFNGDITNNPSGGDISTSGAISGISNARDIEPFKVCDNWYAYIASFSGREINRVDFGASPNTSITTSVDLIGNEFSGRPNSIDLIYSGGEYRLEVLTFEGGLYDVQIGTDPLVTGLTSAAVTNYGAVDIYAEGYFLEILKEEGNWIGFVADDVGNDLYRLDFGDVCVASTGTSDLRVPQSVSYTADGNQRISLTVEDTNGNSDSEFFDVVVDVNIAPVISFTSSAETCISNLIDFTPSNNGLTTYNWDFDGDDIVDLIDMTGANQSFDYTAVGAGTYTVRLDVSDGTCDNFFEQEITIYDPPPAPSYTFSSPRTCINADFTFTNTTNDLSYAGPLEYLWEFIDEPSGTVVATATTKDAVYAFETEGQKTVRLTSSIPGCQEITEQTLMITPGPTANFFASSVCQNEAMQFTNTSIDATSYSWDFGDGFMSTDPNPSHIFSGAGNFFVTLTATDAEGCEDTQVTEVAVSDIPQISFDYDVACTTVDGIQFTDMTTVDNADLVSWTWFVDDVEVSSNQSPRIMFSSTGTKTIRLDVQSSNGCLSSYSEDVDVLISPTPDFNVSLGCQGEISSFTDNTTSAGNPVVSWLWTVDGASYGTQDIDHVFTDPGTYDVTLEVTGQNFCSESITKSVEVIALPAVNFLVNGECDNQLIRAIDQSTESSDFIVDRRWLLDDVNVGNGTQLVLPSLEDANYELTLELETQAGCIISASQTLVINDAPTSSFTSSRTYGIPDDQLFFSNTSTGGTSYQWLLDDQVINIDSQTEGITFDQAGIYDVSLVAQNSLGCNDTASQQVLIAVPEIDLAIGSFELVEENNVGRIFLEVQNLSNLPVESIEARIILENTFTITEQINSFINIGETNLVSLDVGIPLTISEPSYFCVSLTSPYTGYADVSPVNNEKCLTINPIIQVEDPFPNPVTDQFRLKLVVNENSTAKVSLINSAGKLKTSQTNEVTQGLNNFFIDMSTLDPGIYYVTIEVLGTTHCRKIIKL